MSVLTSLEVRTLQGRALSVVTSPEGRTLQGRALM